jgi:hypothetical protein
MLMDCSNCGRINGDFQRARTDYHYDAELDADAIIKVVVYQCPKCGEHAEFEADTGYCRVTRERLLGQRQSGEETEAGK